MIEKSIRVKTEECFYGRYPEDGPDSAEEESRAKERHALGRYTIQEAAFLISKGNKEEAKKMLDCLSFDVRKNILPSYSANSTIKNVFFSNEGVMYFWEEVYWEDLNNWLPDYVSCSVTLDLAIRAA